MSKAWKVAKRNHGARLSVGAKVGVGEAQKVSAEGSRDHVTSHGSLLGAPSRCGACGWSVVQLDHDEEMGPMRGMHGTLDAELEVQRAIKRAELTAFLCVFGRIIGPAAFHVDNR